MILRPYQDRAVAGAVKALREHGNTLIVAPTGAGKTIMMSGLIGRVSPKKALVLQHRDELVAQNMSKFLQVNAGWQVSRFDATQKSWAGRSVFAMVQTLSRQKSLDTICDIDLLVIDECHHTAANSYKKILDAVKVINPNCAIAGFTATPMRADKASLRAAFDNCADQVTIRELVDGGFLVPPRAFVIDVGVQEELKGVRKLASDFDPAQVEQVMNKTVINAEVVRHWKEKAGNRKTIVFCSTIQHSKDVVAAFVEVGIKAERIDGTTPKQKRAALLKAFQKDYIQVIVNVGVLTEGFDEPTVSCVVLLRPCSFKSTMIQMIGRGLRTVNRKEHPNIVKTDCIVLDFGTSILTHGDLDSEVDLSPKEKSERKNDAPSKICPESEVGTAYLVPDLNGKYGCGAAVPVGSAECPFCGFCFEKPGSDDDEIFDAVALSEVDMLNRSPFRWVDLFGTGKAIVASGFGVFAIVASADSQTWSAIGKELGVKRLRLLGVYSKPQAIAAADDFMRQQQTGLDSNKARRWMSDPATEKQAQFLSRFGYDVQLGPMGALNFTKLEAAAHLNFSWNRVQIERLLGVY